MIDLSRLSGVQSPVLVVAPHPDDEVLGMGGTIARLTEAGHSVHVLVLTEGCTSQYPGDADIVKRKRTEAEKANQILGVCSVRFCDLPDMKLDTVPHVDLNRAIEVTINEIRPGTVYVPFPDVNMDHQRAYASTMVAARPAPGSPVSRVLAYPVPSSVEWSPSFPGGAFVPNVFVDISGSLDAKLAAFAVYQSEARPFPHPRSAEAIRIYAQQLGIQFGARAGEGFMLVREIQP